MGKRKGVEFVTVGAGLENALDLEDVNTLTGIPLNGLRDPESPEKHYEILSWQIEHVPGKPSIITTQLAIQVEVVVNDPSA